MPEPLVSVLLPVFNAEPYIGAALESILRQDYRKLEIIAIDDGSTDRSLDILRRYHQADSRISIVSRENRGLVATLNEGLTLARGDLIARMDADDIAYPWRLSRQVEAFRSRAGLAICGSDVDTMQGERILRGTPNPIYRSCELRVLSLFFTLFIHSTVVFDRRVIPQDILRYDAGYPHAEDFDLFRRITGRLPAVMIEESLIVYRVHGESVTSRHKREMRQTHLKIVGENLEREGLSAAPEGLLAIGERVGPETIRSAADWLLALEDAITALPEGQRASYEVGALNFFYFLYQLLGDEQRPDLTHELLTKTCKWGVIRRRERYSLLAGARAPWFSLASIAINRRVDAVARYLKSVPAAALLPSHQPGW
jgi:glycosyltransferase involved in cell wall biosynthesis